MESEHESESNDSSGNKDDALSPVVSAKKSGHDSGSEAEKDIDFNEDKSGSAEMSKSSHSYSSSGSSSDYFQIDAKMPQKSSTFPVVAPEAQEDSQSENLGQNPSLQVSHATNKSTLQMQSPVQSPAIQVMEKPGGYDPNRIPDSVFGRSSSAMDWSVASNESLFSLHLGNNSFSREQFLMMSGELYSSGELNRPNETPKRGRPPLIPLGKLQEEKAVESDNKPEQTKAAEETTEDSLKLDSSDHLEENETEAEVNGHSSMINRPSDASATSTQSFAFPILVDPTKSVTARSDDSLKGPSPRELDMQRAVYEDIVKLETQTKSSSSSWCCCGCNCGSLPHNSCPSCQNSWSWKWCKKWFCCPCC